MSKKIFLWITISLVVIAGIVVLVRSVIPENSEENEALQQVKLRLDWIPGTEHAFYWYGLDRGYYQQEGLKLTIQPGEGSTVSAQLVGAGKSDFGICSGDTAMIARSKGMPIVVLAVLLQESPACIYSLKEKGITKPQDLLGKKYGTIIKSTVHQQFHAFCNKNDVDIDKIEVISVPGNPQELLTGRIDALGGYSFNQPPVLVAKGYPLNIMMLADYGVNIYSMSIITNEGMVKNKPDVVKKFMRTTLRAIQDCLQNKSAAVAAFMKYHPEADADYQKLKFDEIVGLIRKGADKSGGIGLQLEKGWRRTQETLLTTGLIEEEIQLSDFFTNDFLK